MDPFLKLFPNSGHQYFRRFLPELLPDVSEKRLRDLVERNRSGWQAWDECTRWILYRYDLYGSDEIPCIYFCVESNLGEASRGTLFNVEDGDTRGDISEEPDRCMYPAVDQAALNDEFTSDEWGERTYPLQFLPDAEGVEDFEVELFIYFRKIEGKEPVFVDLIIDLGNTRTVGLLLETSSREDTRGSLSRRLYPLRVMPPGEPYEEGRANSSVTKDPYSIIDSWLLLKRTQFAHFEPPLSKDKIYKRIFIDPRDESGEKMTLTQLWHTFVELSPALIGGGNHPDGANRILAGVDLREEHRFFISSPKRYAWDSRPTGLGGTQYWQMLPARGEAKKASPFREFSGLIRYFMDPAGLEYDRNIDNVNVPGAFRPPHHGSEATYPRQDAICWFALSLIEAAYSQINSSFHLEAAGRVGLPRKLRNIRITYPSGWSGEEREAYLAQWQRAIDLFTLSRFDEIDLVDELDGLWGGCRPHLSKPLIDEAVCSQLPILYSDVLSLKGDVEEWLELYGDGKELTVMNVDIGGGTTDVSVIRYSRMGKARNETGSISSILLFRDGRNIAGDALVKAIIEHAILPEWLKTGCLLQFKDQNEDALHTLLNFLRAPRSGNASANDQSISSQLARIVRLVFIPLANRLLQMMGESVTDPHKWEPLSISDLLDTEVCKNWNDLCAGVLKKAASSDPVGDEIFPYRGVDLFIPKASVVGAVEDTFERMFEGFGEMAGRLNCHMAILSGKPSELPELRDLFERNFPLPKSRIVHTMGFTAGSWYPFSSAAAGEVGQINDAKTCTVSGAALYQDMLNGNLSGFSLVDETVYEPSKKYYWGILGASGDTKEFHRNLIFSKVDYRSAIAGDDGRLTFEKTYALPIGCRIGRQLVKIDGVQPDPVYSFDLRFGATRSLVESTVKVKLRWVSEVEKGEYIEFIGLAEGASLPEGLNEDDFKFQLNTLNENEQDFWLDEPNFNVNLTA